MANDKPGKFLGVTSPNTTQVPDQYLDELLPLLSGGELKVLLYITRRTFGFKKLSDNISLSQMLSGIRTRDGRQLDVGVGLSKKTLLQAIRGLRERNIILTERRRSVERGDEPTCYRLKIVGQSHDDGHNAPVGEKLHQGGGGETGPRPWGRNSTTQQTGKQQTEIQHTASSSLLISKGKSDTSSVDVQKTSMPQPGDVLTATSDEGLVVQALMAEFSKDFGDSAHTQANCTQALRLFRASGLAEMPFSRRLYEARSVTRDQINRRRLAGSEVPVQKAMPYFFAVLKDLLWPNDGRGTKRLAGQSRQGTGEEAQAREEGAR